MDLLPISTETVIDPVASFQNTLAFLLLPVLIYWGSIWILQRSKNTAAPVRQEWLKEITFFILTSTTWAILLRHNLFTYSVNGGKPQSWTWDILWVAFSLLVIIWISSLRDTQKKPWKLLLHILWVGLLTAFLFF